MVIPLIHTMGLKQELVPPAARKLLASLFSGFDFTQSRHKELCVEKPILEKLFRNQLAGYGTANWQQLASIFAFRDTSKSLLTL